MHGVGGMGGGGLKLSFYGKTTCCFTQHPEMQTKEANNKKQKFHA